MPVHTPIQSRPIVIDSSTEAQVYMLFALAMGLTVLGVFIGAQFALAILTAGWQFLFLIVELAIIFTARWWMDKSPLNYLLFGIFPLLTGITVAPFLLLVSTQYVNGNAIIMNALASTAFMAAAAAVFARTTRWNLGVMGRGLFFALLGLILMGVLQIFFPALRGGQMELLLSGAGVVIFALFTAYDVQRVTEMSRYGANPFMLALSLYLDIFNLFLYVLRFMIALSGNRR
jgi:FtsH-binding integral membrane protein